MNKNYINQMIVSVLAIVIGEMLIFSGQAIYGLALHIIHLQALTILIIKDRNFFPISRDMDIKPIFQSFALLLLMRIVNMAMPIFFIPSIFWISVIYGVMFIPIYSVLKHQNFTLKEVGFQCRKLNVFALSYLPVALFIGYMLALLEFQIIQPEPMIDNLNVQNVIVLSLIMFLFVALVEELIFRSILQTGLERALGMNRGLLLASILFGIMHSGYGSFNEILFATFAGMVIGFLYQKTRCLPFIVIIHGTINVFVFGIVSLTL